MNDDDASIAQREQKIEEMRARVEARLQSLLHGDPLDKLRQQVSDLRESTLQQSQHSLGIDNETSINEQEEEEDEQEDDAQDIQWDPQTDIHFDPSVATFVSSSNRETSDIYFDPKEPLFVERTEIQDPYGDAGSYTGKILASTQKPHGQGRMEYYDGRSYEGDWSHGQWHGHGSVQFGNGDVYQGNYVKDQRSGEFGIYCCNILCVVKMLTLLYAGFGMYRWKDGRVYEGNFLEDQRNGLGEVSIVGTIARVLRV